MIITDIPTKQIGSELTHEEFNTIVTDLKNKLYRVPTVGENYNDGNGNAGVVVAVENWEDDDNINKGSSLVTLANQSALIDAEELSLEDAIALDGNLMSLEVAQKMLDAGFFTFVSDVQFWGDQSNVGGEQMIIWLDSVSGELDSDMVTPGPTVKYKALTTSSVTVNRHNWEYVLELAKNLINVTENSYADNAAALAGGLEAGQFYHTSGVIKVVL